MNTKEILLYLIALLMTSLMSIQIYKYNNSKEPKCEIIKQYIIPEFHYPDDVGGHTWPKQQL